MSSRKVTEEDRARVNNDIAYLKERGVSVRSRSGLFFQVEYKGKKAHYWPLSNTFKVLQTNRSHIVLRSENPPQKLIEKLGALVGEIPP